MGAGAAASRDVGIPLSVQLKVNAQLSLLQSNKVEASNNIYNLCHDEECRPHLGKLSLGILPLLPLAVADDNSKIGLIAYNNS